MFEKFLQVVILANQSLACIHFLLVKRKIEKKRKKVQKLFLEKKTDSKHKE